MKLFMFAILAMVANPYCALAHDGHTHVASEDLDKNRPHAMSDESIFQLDSAWTDALGKQIVLSVFHGHPSVLAMIYTSCQGACPIITSDIQRIEKKLSPSEREKTQFILASFDPERDTPERLKKFAANHELDLHRWTLLTGSQDGVRNLAAVLSIKYKKDPSGDFSHSNVITILDSEGRIRYQQVGLRQDPKVSADMISNAFKAIK